MTAKEFNEKYKDRLEEGHYGLDINNVEVVHYLDNVLGVFFQIIPDLKFSQIKLKFGRPSCYLRSDNASNEEVRKLESAIEEGIRIFTG